MRVHFGCAETAPGVWTTRFNDPTIRTPSHWDELRQISLQHNKVLVLGIFDWSNYSHSVVTDIIDNREYFETHDIGLAAFCACSPSQVGLLCPDFLSHYLRAKTEPLMFVLERGSLKKTRFGPMDSSSILKWVLSDSTADP